MNDLLGGRYRLGTALGRGGMGTVYEAVQENLGRRVAIKLLDERLSYDREQLERFRREAEVVAALGHPNIVQVTDFQYPEELGKQPFLVMELLRGESLASRIEHDGAMTAERVAFIVAQVLSALVSAHRAGVVHRDIKPDNIFLLAEAAVPDTVKVLDFGIAKLTDGASIGPAQQKLTSTNAMLGTPAFMAPEQARGAVDVDARADVYAVGATMYQALTGRLPFEAASVPALLFAIVEKTPPPLRELRPDLPSDFIAVVDRAMAKDRDVRFASADDMRRALAPWSGLPASIPPPISATAATVASGKIVPHDPATPIVVHRTPPPATKSVASAVPASPPSSSERRGTSPLVLLTILLVAGMFTAVAIVGIVSFTRGSSTAASSSPLFPTAVASASTTVATTNVVASTNVIASTTTASAITITSATAAPAAPKKKRYGGKDGYLSSTNFGDCKACDWDAFRSDLKLHQGEITKCYADTQYQPPLHESVYYEFAVTDTGVITLQKADGALATLDRCLGAIVTHIPMRMSSAKPGAFNLSFRGECTPGWGNHCVD